MKYFDFNATTPLSSLAEEVWIKTNREYWQNPSSPYTPSARAKNHLESLRERLASILSCQSNNIIFNSGATEGNNAVINYFAKNNIPQSRILISAIEHPSVLKAAKNTFLEKADFIPVSTSGVVEIAKLKTLIKNKKYSLVSVMAANNETGVIQPLLKLSSIARDHGIPFHSDGVQAIGKIPVDVYKTGVSMMSFSAHKFYGPKGVGALYVGKGIKLHPLIHGGGQEQTLRAGTENVAGISGFGFACELAAENLPLESKRLSELRDRTTDHIFREFPDAVVHGDNNNRLPGVISVGLPGIDAQSLMMKLDLDGFAVSTGAACSSGVSRPSRSLKAMGLTDVECKSTLRVSLGQHTQESDVNAFLDCFISHVRTMMGQDKIGVAA